MNSTTTATNDLNTCKSSNRTASTQKAMPGCKILARGLISTAPARKTCSKSGCPASREHSPVARESYSFNPSLPADARVRSSFGFRPPSRNEGKLTAIRTLPATVNLHLNRACNFGCRYCYPATVPADAQPIHGSSRPTPKSRVSPLHISRAPTFRRRLSLLEVHALRIPSFPLILP